MADIGSTLREARMHAKIDISEVEARTKIRAKYLRAIENEDWDVLPGTVYAKSFLRTYGDFLGLDSRMLVEEFKRRYEHPLDQEPRPMPASVPRDRERPARGSIGGPRRPLIPPWAVIGLVLLAIVVVLYIVGSSATKTSTTPHAKARRSHHRAKQHGSSTPAPAPAPSTVTLQLVPTGTVYVCLVNGRGDKLVDQRTFTAGETIPNQTAQKLLLTLGRAAVQMKVNGKDVPVAVSSSAIRFLLTPTAVQHVPLSMQPTCP